MKKYIKFIIAILALTVAIATAAIVAYGSTEPSATVERYNLTFKDSVYISYAVSFENVPDGAETGILVWEDPQSAYTVESAGYTKITERSGTASFGGVACNVYDYKDIAAKEMTKDIYVVGFINDGGSYTYSELAKYSVLQYVYNKLGLSGIGTPTTDEDFVALLNSLLEYGAAAQEHFGENVEDLATARYYMISVSGGRLADLSDRGLYRAGVSLTVTASARTDGTTFVRWVDGDGNVLSEDATFTYTVLEKNTDIIAVYE